MQKNLVNLQEQTVNLDTTLPNFNFQMSIILYLR